MPRDLVPLDPENVTLADLAEAINDALTFSVAALQKVDVVAKVAGPQGIAGRDGIDGKPGGRGADGIGLLGAAIDEAGRLVLTLSNGVTVPLGVVRGDRGPAGADGESIRGEIGPAGPPGASVKGDPGPAGLDGESIQGERGYDGTGIQGAVIDRSGHLILTLTNGITIDVGPICGRDGNDADMSLIQQLVDRVDGLTREIELIRAETTKNLVEDAAFSNRIKSILEPMSI